jgi:hypothetical protein
MALFPFSLTVKFALQCPGGGIPNLDLSAEMLCEKELAVVRVVDGEDRSEIVTRRVGCLKNMKRLV